MHPILEMINRRNKGECVGIASYCTANELVIEAALERAAASDTPVLIEATANQVNQFGGYTGMKPEDFRKFVMKIAEKTGCQEELIILGGDHLGPLTWQKDTEAVAMEKSEELVYQYVRAGFTKIHLDTSMKLADDAADRPLETQVIAERGAKLYQSCLKAYAELLAEDSQALRPVFIIGSEVPIPGGAQEEEEGISVTKPEDFKNTVDTYKRVFASCGLEDAWQDIVAVVVQPGVEFGDGQVFMYDRAEAKALCDTLKQYPEIVFEGHSTDYQSPECLREMVEDGIAILKVGPALTFGLRQALFSLSMIEKELVPEDRRADLMEVLEAVMIERPQNWQNHYHGDERTQALARKYSFSDRSRYYLGEPEVAAATAKLIRNLTEIQIPINILMQYMPVQYHKVRAGQLELDPRELAKDGAVQFMEEYKYAII